MPARLKFIDHPDLPLWLAEMQESLQTLAESLSWKTAQSVSILLADRPTMIAVQLYLTRGVATMPDVAHDQSMLDEVKRFIEYLGEEIEKCDEIDRQIGLQNMQAGLVFASAEEKRKYWESRTKGNRLQKTVKRFLYKHGLRKIPRTTIH